MPHLTNSPRPMENVETVQVDALDEQDVENHVAAVHEQAGRIDARLSSSRTLFRVDAIVQTVKHFRQTVIVDAPRDRHATVPVSATTWSLRCRSARSRKHTTPRAAPRRNRTRG